MQGPVERIRQFQVYLGGEPLEISTAHLHRLNLSSDVFKRCFAALVQKFF